MIAQLLHTRLESASIPIYGITLDGFDGITVRYHESATPEQRRLGDQIVAEFDAKLEQRRFDKLQELAAWWKAVELGGIAVGDIRLGASPQDIAMLTAQFVLAQTAIQLGIRQPADTFVVIDVQGDVHQLTLAQLTSLLLTYGEHRTQAATQYLAYKAMITQATVLAQLDAITLA